MSLVLRAQLRFLWRARGSLLSALLGMSIGVASVTGVHLLSAQVAQRVEQQARPFGPADLYLQRTELSEQDYFDLRKRWRAGELAGVAALFPLLEGEVELRGEPYLLVGTDALAVAFLKNAATPLDDAAIVDAGDYSRWLTSDSVYLPRSLAGSIDSSSIQLGNVHVDVLGFNAPDRVILADLPTAQAVLGGRMSRIGVVLAVGAQHATFGGRVRAFAGQLFPGALTEPAAEPLPSLDASWRQIPAATDNPTRQLLQSVLFNVAALSVLALVVAWLLTYQVACHALGRRRSMFVRLQSLGVARRRLRALTFIEGVVLGIGATFAGLGLGVVLANALLAAALGTPFAFDLPLGGFVWFKALVSGIGVAGLSYTLAANRSLFAKAGVSVTNPGGQAADESMAGKRAWLLFAGLLAVFAWGLWGNSLAGAFACVVVCALVLLIYLPVLAGWLWQQTRTRPVAQILPLRMLAVRQLLRGQELRLGVSALALALATALGIGIMVDSFRGAFIDMLDRRLADDLVVTVPTATPATRKLFERTLQARADSLFWRGSVPITARDVSGQFEFADDHAELLARFVPAGAVSSQALAVDAVFINESFARLHSLEQGSALSLQGGNGSAAATVAGIFSDYGELRPRLLGRREIAATLHGEARLDELYVRTQQLPALRAALAAMAEQWSLRVRDQSQVRQQSIRAFEQTFAITRALTWLALLVAVVALANALAAHSLQQQGTARQLHVLGLARAGQKRLRIVRAVYAGGAAIVLAVPTGLAIAALLCLVVNPRAFGWSFAMQLTPAGIGWPLAGGLLGVVLAAALGGLIARRETTYAVQSPWLVSLVAMVVSLLVGCAPANEPNSVAPTLAPAPGLRVGSVLGGAAEGFSRVTAVRPFDFPRDHGAHPNYKSEWWYLTCPLAGATSGAEYGVQFTLFRQALQPPNKTEVANLWRDGQIYMAHAALTSITDARHFEASRFARGHPQLAGVTAAPFAAWLEDWRLSAAPATDASVDGNGSQPSDGMTNLHLSVNDTKFQVSLDLRAVKPLVLQGDRGLSYKGSREASYYYSLPRLSALGSVQLGNDKADEVSVAGTCWLDREWSTSVLADNLVGWDWFALQLDDGTDYMLFQLREAAAQVDPDLSSLYSKRGGKYVAATGESRSLSGEQLHFEPLDYWSDETGARWPVAWRVNIGELELRVVAALADQRMRSTIAYWEGLVWVFDGDQRIGQGYLEMTGYVGD